MLRTSREAWNRGSGKPVPPWDLVLLSGRSGMVEACDQAGEENDGDLESQMRGKGLLLHVVAAAVQPLDAAASPWQLDCCSDLKKTTFRVGRRMRFL